jgi:hypothetical protein
MVWLTVFRIVKLKFTRDVTVINNKINMVTVYPPKIARHNVMVEMEQYKQDWVFANVTILKTLMIYVIKIVEQMQNRLLLVRMDKY